jgi:hypothetical protein
MQLYCETYRVAAVDREPLNVTKAAAPAISSMAASGGQTSSHGDDEKSPRVPTRTLLPGNVCEMLIKSTLRFQASCVRKFRTKFFLLH